MCLAVPLRIEVIQGEMATVELDGVRREVSLVFTPEAQAGDYVIVHAGFALSVLDQDEAEETLELFRAMSEMTRTR